GSAQPAAPTAARARRPGKLSFNEERELAGMEAAIEAAEAEKGRLEALLSDQETYRRDGAAVPAMRARLEELTAEVDRLYARWQELEGLRAGR
ncbi:MAG TPA: ABC transporter C-terminal domain-containing protein, partial [Anaeromyxobacteraceae bacterium]|nr:ABC transporter C-terminal domain-containing protein [Anaeromyxobacteraceae bacterium]